MRSVAVEPLAGRMVTIRVGDPQAPTEFIVHEEILKSATGSKFFKVAFNNGFKETTTGVLKLPEDDVDAFRLLLHWAYVNATGFTKCEKKAFFEHIDTSTLIKLYVLASKYTMNTLHDAVITYLWWKCNSSACWLQMCFSKDALSYFEENTMVDCHLDKLLIDWMIDDALSCTSCEGVDYQSVFDAMPDRLMRAAFVKAHHAIPRTAATNHCKYCNGGSVYRNGNAQIFCRNCGREQKQKGDLCSYHCHSADQPCTAPVYVDR